MPKWLPKDHEMSQKMKPKSIKGRGEARKGEEGERKGEERRGEERKGRTGKEKKGDRFWRQGDFPATQRLEGEVYLTLKGGTALEYPPKILGKEMAKEKRNGKENHKEMRGRIGARKGEGM